MSTERYRVSSSPAVNSEFRQILLLAKSKGLLPGAILAADWIMSELARTPDEFGESRDQLPAMNLHLRVAFVEPLVVQFAVHRESRIVFIRNFGLYSRRSG